MLETSKTRKENNNMKDISARTDSNGAVLLGIEAGQLFATVNMNTGGIEISIFDDDGNEFDQTSEVLKDWTDCQIRCFAHLIDLQDAMEEWEPPEPDFDGAPEPELYHGPRNFPEY